MTIRSFIKTTLNHNYFTDRPQFANDYRVAAVDLLAPYTKGKKMDEEIGFDTTNYTLISIVRGLSCNGYASFHAVTCLDLSFVRFTKRAVENLAKSIWQDHYDMNNGLWYGEKIESLNEWVELITA